MNQLEAQVNDLRSFLAVPSLAAQEDEYSPGPHHPSNQHASPLSAPGDNSAPQNPQSPLEADHQHGAQKSAKRKAEESESLASKQQRSKRNRYISIACNECKRRKIKCNGESPCQRCGNLNLQCLYAPNCCSSSLKDSEEFKQMAEHVMRLQEQVDSLFNSMTTLRQETLRLAPIHDRVLPLPAAAAAATTPSPSISSAQSLPRPPFPSRVPPSFSGPTSTAFTVDMAKNTLHNMGYSDLADGVEETGVREASPSSATPVLRPTEAAAAPRPRDPLWEFDKEEMVRLCKIHEEEVGVMYPVVKIDTIIKHAEFLGSWMESWSDASKRNGIPPSLHGEGDGISDMNSLLLKIIMCCGLAVEEHGNSAKAARLYESIQPIVDKKLMSDAPDVANLPFLALVGGYRFLSNDEIIAWRVMGQVARLCLELGLHRRDGLEKIEDPQARKNALNTFWSSYVLDRRWSFGTGLPYVCHDDKIDPKLPYPDNYPYLVAMISYSKLGARIWKLVDYFEPAVIRELQRSDFEQLDDEILRWYDTVPEEVKIPSLDMEMVPLPAGPSYDLHRLQIWTRLRLNQIRIWLYTPVLHSANSIAHNAVLAQRVVDLAKDTIRYLARLNNTTNLYRRIPVFYHQFLTSAIAVLFLASTHAPLQFSVRCRAEFYRALELVKDMSARSWVSQRLWRTIRSLKAYAVRLGMEETSEHRSLPAGVAGPSPAPGYESLRRSSANAVQSPGQFPPPPYSSSRSSQTPHNPGPVPGSEVSTPASRPAHTTEDHSNGLSLQTEMSRIFEGYMGMNGIPQLPGSQSQSPEQSHPAPARGSVAELVETKSPTSSNGQPGSGGRNTNGSVYQHFKDMF